MKNWQTDMVDVLKPLLPAASVAAFSDFAPPLDPKGLLAILLVVFCLLGYACEVVTRPKDRAPHDLQRLEGKRLLVGCFSAIAGLAVCFGFGVPTFVREVYGKATYVGFESPAYKRARNEFRTSDIGSEPTTESILERLRQLEQVDLKQGTVNPSHDPWVPYSVPFGLAVVWMSFASGLGSMVFISILGSRMLQSENTERVIATPEP